MQLAMALGCRLFGLSCAEAILAGTANAAAALGLAGRAGSLARGCPADLVIWDAGSYEEIPYRIADDRAKLVFKGGLPVAPAGVSGAPGEHDGGLTCREGR